MTSSGACSTSRWTAGWSSCGPRTSSASGRRWPDDRPPRPPVRSAAPLLGAARPRLPPHVPGPRTGPAAAVRRRRAGRSQPVRHRPVDRHAEGARRLAGAGAPGAEEDPMKTTHAALAIAAALVFGTASGAAIVATPTIQAPHECTVMATTAEEPSRLGGELPTAVNDRGDALDPKTYRIHDAEV